MWICGEIVDNLSTIVDKFIYLPDMSVILSHIYLPDIRGYVDKISNSEIDVKIV